MYPWIIGLFLVAGGLLMPSDRKIDNAADKELFEAKMAMANSNPDKCLSPVDFAKSFLGTPYKTGCLECKGSEELVVNLRQLDCWTLVEHSLALTKASREKTNQEEVFLESLQQLRYWEGEIEGYASRIHYFSGWMLQAEKMGYIRDIGLQLGGQPLKKEINFMSRHPERYTKLKDQSTLNGIRRVEECLSQQEWYYIPKQQVSAIEDKLQEGDLIAITSYKRGLDVAHEGFAVEQNGRIHLLHASSLGKRVLISRLPLAEYLKSQRGQSGIIVARIRTSS